MAENSVGLNSTPLRVNATGSGFFSSSSLLQPIIIIAAITKR
jgi:hypothetical protein